MPAEYQPIDAERVIFLEDRAALCADVLGHAMKITLRLHRIHAVEGDSFTQCAEPDCRKTQELLTKAAHGLPG